MSFPGPNSGGGWLAFLTIVLGLGYVAWYIHPILLIVLVAATLYYLFKDSDNGSNGSQA
jgi:hypothetical protein